MLNKIGCVFNTLLVLVQETTKKAKDSLRFTVFNKNQIEILLKRVSTEKKDFLKKYYKGKIRCASCNKIIGPKSKENLILGGIIIEGEDTKFLCRELKCYEKGQR